MNRAPADAPMLTISAIKDPTFLGCAFSGASMPASLILRCSRLASSTVIVSPSATPTTVPVRVSAEAVTPSISNRGNQELLVRMVELNRVMAGEGNSSLSLAIDETAPARLNAIRRRNMLMEFGRRDGMRVRDAEQHAPGLGHLGSFRKPGSGQRSGNITSSRRQLKTVACRSAKLARRSSGW